MKFPQESLDKAIELAQRAVAQDGDFSDGHRLMSLLYCYHREYDKGLAEGEWSVDLDPNGAETLNNYGLVLFFSGRTDEAIPIFKKAIRLNPNGPSYFFWSYASALRAKGRFDEAISAYQKALQRNPNDIITHLGLAATYSLMGREQEARTQAAEVLRVDPKFLVDTWAKRLPYKDHSVVDKFVDALLKAGLK
jgi:tetratricopeptide (TPR) repeat protein